MKKILALVLALVLSLSLTSAFAAEKISVIATENPHAEVMELIKDDLAALGYELELTVVSDYVVENPATSAGDVMANFFQHVPYLAGYNAEVSEEEQLVAVIYTHFEPMALYAGTKATLEEIAEGDKIAVPNDPVNENRALLLLQNAGLIKLPEGTTLESTCTPMDIVENPYNLEIVELNAELIPGARADVANREFRIEIKDKGRGIPNLDEAMQPLYTTDKENERSGMGFTIMENFMDSLKVTSVSGGGTKVVMSKRFTEIPRIK